jgi:hypothetical protein
MAVNAAILDVIGQLESIVAAPHYTIAPAEPTNGYAPARRSRPEIVAVDPSERTSIPEGLTKEQIRAEATATIDAYLAQSIVTYRLLLNLPPGIGKTWQGVRAAHKAQAQGLRVAYIMPRHAFYLDLISMSVSQGYGSGYWHHWQPRREGDDQGQGETCHHTAKITQWIRKGHQGAKFCGGVCGYKFMHDECTYLGQPRTIELRSSGGIVPIVAIQHQHLVSGHTMMHDFDLVIGDESPLGVYPWIWHIPTGYLIDPRLADLPAAAFMPIMDRLARTMAHNITIEGDGLIQALGGADHVLATIRATIFPDSALSVNAAESVESAPYDYLALMCDTLLSEARESSAGQDYIHRIILKPDGLHLLLKKDTTQDLPAKVIWLDATASPELYSAVTAWRVESFTRHARLEGPIIQVTEGVFSKTSMLRGKSPSPQARQTARIIDHIVEREGYRDPLIVSYQDLGSLFKDKYRYTYFHGNRGSNEFESCDAVFILGTPQPPIAQVELLGRMFYPRRSEPFNAAWCKKPIAYTGHDRAYLASGLWADSDLELILDQVREQEIVQSAHRVRPILSPKPIWLFTALPVASLPPTRLCSLLDVLGIATEGIDAGTFLDALDIAETLYNQCSDKEYPYFESQQMMLMLDVSYPTVKKYFDALTEYDPDRYPPLEIRGIGRGRPRKGIGRLPESEE